MYGKDIEENLESEFQIEKEKDKSFRVDKYFGKILTKNDIKEINQNWVKSVGLLRDKVMILADTFNNNNRVIRHAVAFYVSQDEQLFFFDSCAEPCWMYGYDVIQFVEAFSKVHFLKEPFQVKESNMCAGYCIYYVIHICLGKTHEQIIQEMLYNGINDKYMFEKCIKIPSLKERKFMYVVDKDDSYMTMRVWQNNVTWRESYFNNAGNWQLFMTNTE